MPGFEYKHVEGPLRASGYLEDIKMWYTENDGKDEGSIRKAIVDYRPDALYICHQILSEPFSETFLRGIQAEGIPIVACYFDPPDPRIGQVADFYSPWVVANLPMGTCGKQDYIASGNYLYPGLPFILPTYNSFAYVDIDVSFLGTIFAERRPYIELMRSAGIRVFCKGGIENGSGRWLSYRQYLGYMSRSKITVNFSCYYTGMHSMRARVLEAFHCSTLLLEEENPVTATFFEPWRDYIPFTKDTLVPLLREYLQDVSKRNKVRLQGHAALRTYMPRNFVQLLSSRVVTGNFSSGEVWNKEFYLAHLGEEL